jgi:cell division protein FtsI/penicillin-binding protein 2
MTEAINKFRFVFVIVVIIFFVVIVFGRLFYLQIIKYDYYKEEALSQEQGIVKIELPRTQFTDRNGVILAASIEKPSLCTVKPKEIKNPETLAREVSKLSSEQEKNILQRLKTRTAFTWIGRKLPIEFSDEVEKIANSYDKVSLIREWGRYYPKGIFASNLIGTVGVDGGICGLEENWNERLSKGEREYIVYRVGNKVRLFPIETINSIIPEPDSIALTIDEPIQYEVEKCLDDVVSTYNPKSACAIVLSIPDGEILALGVRPTFDPNNLNSISFEEDKVNYRNITVLDSFEPGSTFKPFTIATALDGGFITPYQEVMVTPLTVGNHTIKDDHPPHSNYYQIEDVLAYSSNCGAGRIGMMIPKDKFYESLRNFGFGSITELKWKGESCGVLRNPDNKKIPWSALSAPSIAFGQEVRVTPMQLAVGYATIANKGIKVTPKIELGKKDEKRERVISEETANILSKMLVSVVDKGTGKSASIPYVEIAGKTGTAQKLGIKTDSFRKGRIAYFAGFAPRENPKVVILVMVDDPIGQVYGGAVSAPLFARINSIALKRSGFDIKPYIKADLAMMGVKR